ncbi:MAG: hypothetical protein IPJ77_09760 [Planctomycetes bacterium]|nr:hypothetical protein [Planctomycetota bacterium]
MTHDPKHEELVMRVVTGELGEDAPEWREQRASCAQCEAEVRELRHLDAGLERIGQEVVADVAAARTMPPVGEEALVEKALRRAVGSAPASPPRRALKRFHVGWFLTVAAAVLAMVLARAVFLSTDPVHDGQDELLGGLDARLDRPDVAADRSLTLSWSVGRPTNGHYELQLLTGPSEQGPWVDTRLDTGRITGLSWHSSPGFASSLQPFIRWRVIEKTAGLERLSSGWAVHSLSP